MCVKKKLLFPLIIVVALAIFALACNLSGSGDESLPMASILAPASGSTVAINSDVTVQISASDAEGAGITRIDLLVDDVVVDSYDSPAAQNDIAVNLNFVPTEEKAITVAVVAFREDGTSSLPATVALSVVGVSVEAPVEDSSDTTDDATEEPTTEESDADEGGDESASVPMVEARANTTVAIRQAPGPGCPIIGEVPEDEVIELLQKTDDPTEYWYQTNYLGENILGWVYHDLFTLLGDDGILPLVPQIGCLYCGDSICSSELLETCQSCEVDCGACCGNGACDYGETCQTCETDCGACCGNGACDYGEDCSTCESDCGSCCGNGACDHGEDCSTCESDCGACCGNGACDHGETCETCETDCGECPAVCGNGVVETGEACDPPYSICYDSEGYAGDCSGDCSVCAGPD
jgi:hypothetical protein